MRRLIKVLFIVFAIAVLISPQWIAHARLTPLSVNDVTKLSGLMVAGGEVNSFEISPDGNYVVFRADKDLAGKMELYSVDLQSLELEKLNQNIPDDYDISNILISPNSQWVVYSVSTSSGGMYLRSVLIGGGDSYVITHPFHSSTDYARGFEITPDSAYVIFTSDYATEDFYFRLRHGRFLRII